VINLVKSNAYSGCISFKVTISIIFLNNIGGYQILESIGIKSPLHLNVG